MSYSQPRPDRSETQYRRIGRSAGYHHQQRPTSGGYSKGSGAGTAPAPSISVDTSSNRSVKKANNAQGGQPRVNFPPVNHSVSKDGLPHNNSSGSNVQSWSQVTGATGAPVMGGATNSTDSSSSTRSSRPIPKAPTSQSTAVSSKSNETGTPKGSGDASKAFALQFGSLGPDLMKIPARTSSAPPNMDEHKRAQMQQGALRSAPNKQDFQKAVDNQSTRKEGHDSAKEKRDVQVPHIPPPSQTQKPHVAHIRMPSVQTPYQHAQIPHPVHFGGPNMHMQPQNVTAGSFHQMPMPIALSMGNSPHMQPQLFFQGLPSHPMPHQSLMHRPQGLNYANSVPPQIHPQLGHMGVGLSPQFSPQQVGISGGPRKTTPTTPVKITHPDTHEELRLDRRGDTYMDGGSVTSKSHPNTPPRPQLVSSFVPRPVNSVQTPYNFNTMVYPPASVPLHSTPVSSTQTFLASEGSQRIQFINQSALTSPQHTRPIVSGDRLSKSSAMGNARDAQNVMSAIPPAIVKVTLKPAATCEKLGSLKDLKSCVEDNSSLSQKTEEVKTATERKRENANESNSNKDYQEQTCKVETAELRTDDVGQTKVSDPSLPSSCLITKTETVDSEKDSSLPGLRKQIVELPPTSETWTSDAPYMNMDNISMGSRQTSSEISCSPSPKEELQCDVQNVSDKFVEKHETSEEKHDSKSVVLMNHNDLTTDVNQPTSNHSSPRDGTEQNAVDEATDVCLGLEKVADIASDLSSEIPHSAHLQHSSVPRGQSDELPKDHGVENSGDGLTLVAPTAISRNKSAFESNMARNTSAKGKKKKKEILQKADAAGTTSDLYMAYKGPEEKKETTPSSESSSVVQDTSNQNQEPAKLPAVAEATVETEQIKNEPEDWEDAADVSTPKLETSDYALDAKRGSSDDVYSNTEKKYSRDFLLKFAEQCTALPEGFKALPDIANLVFCANMGTSHLGRDSHPTPGKVVDRQSSASRADRRSGNMVVDDRWTKNQGSFGLGYGGNVGFQPGQAGNSGVLRNPRMQAPIMTRPMQSVVHMGGMGRNIPDSERWQRASNFQQKGLFPYPHTPMPVMHKAEKKYQVGKVTDEEQAKQRQLKGILNKLTPQNFEKLFEQVKSVNIDNAGTLTGVISQIFDKALMEPTFCEMYADFCLHLSGELPEFEEDGEKTTFRRVLLNKCQEEFERGEKEEEEAARAEEGQVKQTEREREEKRVKARRRMLGNIRLIGELYKKRMLTEKIMHGCIKKLLGYNQDPDEENIEALCKLMSTIGVMIDYPKAKAVIDNYFEKITILSNKPELATRLRFLLRDVIDLRKNKWQQRRKVDGPKKIDEVHRDAEQELKTQASRHSRGPSSMNTSARKGSTDFGSRGGMLASPSSQMGSYHASPKSRGYGNQDIRFDDRQLYDNRMVPMPQRSSAEESITLGPQGGLGQGMSTRRPATAVSSTLPSDASAASGDPRQRPGGLTNFGAQRPASPAAYGRPSSAQGRGTNYGGRDAASLSRASDLSTGAPSGMQAQGSYLTESTPQENAFPEERLREMSFAAIKEFYSARDEKEMGLCIKDLKSPNFHPTMISLWVTDSFERKDVERDILTKLLINLVKSPDRFITESQLIKGFESVLTTIEDAVNDAPRAGEYLGRILGKSVIEKVVTLQEIGRLIRNGGEEPGNLIEFGLGGDVLGSALDVIKSEAGQHQFQQIQQNSGLCLNDFKPRPPSRSKILDKFT